MKAFKKKVFLSHTAVDKAIVTEIGERLKFLGIPIWRDIDDIDVGDQLMPSITKGIDESTFIAVFLSRDALRSKWVQDELRIAFSQTQDAKKKILPIFLEPFADEELPGYLRGLVYADLTKKTEDKIVSTVKILRKAIESFGKKYDGPMKGLTSAQLIVLMSTNYFQRKNIDNTIENLVEATGMPLWIVECTIKELEIEGLIGTVGNGNTDNNREIDYTFRDRANKLSILMGLNLETQDGPDFLEIASDVLDVPLIEMEYVVELFKANGEMSADISIEELRVIRKIRNDLSSLPKEESEIEKILDSLVAEGIVEKKCEPGKPDTYHPKISDDEFIDILGIENDKERTIWKKILGQMRSDKN